MPFRIGSRIKAILTAAPGEVEEAGAPTTIADLSDPERLAEADATLVLGRWISLLDLRWFYLSDLMRKPASLFDHRLAAEHSHLRASGLKVLLFRCGI